jgi:hypothetical protein
MIFYANVATSNLTSLENNTTPLFIHLHVSRHKSKIPTIPQHHMSQKAKHCNKILSQCFIQNQNIPSHIDATTTIICTHKKYVQKQYHGSKQTIFKL